MSSVTIDFPKFNIELLEFGDVSKKEIEGGKGHYFNVPLIYNKMKYFEFQLPSVTCFRRYENKKTEEFQSSKKNSFKKQHKQYSYLCALPKDAQEFFANIEERILDKLTPIALTDLGFKAKTRGGIIDTLRVIFKSNYMIADQRDGTPIPENERIATTFMPDKWGAKFYKPNLELMTEEEMEKTFSKCRVEMVPTIALRWIYVKSDKISIQWYLSQVLITKIVPKSRKLEINDTIKGAMMDTDIEEFNRMFSQLEMEEDESNSPEVTPKMKEALKPKVPDDVSINRFLKNAPKPASSVADDEDFE